MDDAKTFKELIGQIFAISDDGEIHSIYVEGFDYSKIMDYRLEKRIRKMLREEK